MYIQHIFAREIEKEKDCIVPYYWISTGAPPAAVAAAPSYASPWGKHRLSRVHKTHCFPQAQSISVNYLRILHFLQNGHQSYKWTRVILGFPSPL